MANQGFGEVAERLRRSTVQIIGGRGRRSAGSGVIWAADGLIVTNAHVAAGRVRVELWDGRQFEANVGVRDARRDLASLRITAGNLPAAPAGDSSVLRPGQLVLAVGNPLGFIGALTTGVVHALGPFPGVGRRSWVQAAVRLAPGNSGGPLADAEGRVIGLNTMLASGGLALAVPSNSIVEFLRRGASPAMLGVTVRPVLLEQGRSVALLVLETAAGGAAEAASILIGDLLLAADGKPFRSAEDLSDAIEEAEAGVLALQFTRGNSRSQRQVMVRLVRSAEAA